MAKKHEQVQDQQEHKQEEQPVTPAKSLELTEEELGQVVGGVIAIIKVENPSALPDLDAGGHA